MSDLPETTVRHFTELFSTPAFPPDPRDTDEAKKATAWNAKFEPRPDRDYEVEFDYAMKLYEESSEGFDRVDDKGEFLFKFTAFALGGIPTASKAMDLKITFWTVASFVFFGLAFVFLLISIYRARKSTPVDVSNILDFSTKPDRLPDATNDQVTHLTRGFLAASAHVAISEINAIVGWKSQQQARACVCIILGLAFAMIWACR